MSDGKITLNKNGPILQNTNLGWIVSGAITSPSKHFICNLANTIIPEDSQLKRFWEINDFNNSTSLSMSDLHCEELFLKNTSRSDSGQFIVKLPLKYSSNLLGDSKDVAVKRMLALEKKFNSNINFYNLYNEFIEEYIRLGHMTKVASEDLSVPHYYLPHHGIFKESSLSTKLRVVFDGSCATDTGWSLNDLQYVEPKVQNNICDILIRFRLYKYVVSADVSKMYRQVLMHKDHRPLQQIIWRESPTQQFSTYQLNTITYGTTSAPYLAIKCMNQLAIERKETCPKASETILSDFYVDDLLTGSDNIIELQARCKTISSILKSGHFME